MKWPLLFLILAIALLLLVAHKDDKEREIKAEIARQERVASFNLEFERAKRATADPCATVPFELVIRLSAGVPPKLVMMGYEINYTALGPGAYRFQANGDKTELWENVPDNQHGVTGTKVAEKYNADSKFCYDLAAKK